MRKFRLKNVMIKTIDLNADIGEASTAEWAASEAAILAHISSANIACGGHAGDIETMRRTIAGACENGVTMGAHPGYPDRKNFGRLELTLGEDIEAAALSESLYVQVSTLMEASAGEAKYVKPHGALYNQAVGTAKLADLIGDVILRVDSALTWLGGPQSEMMRAAKDRGLNFVFEAFVDRQYDDHGHLVSRKLGGAVIAENEARISQALSLAKDNCVTTRSGQTLNITPASLCVHGDSPGAVETARLARAALEEAGLMIRPFA